MRGLFRVAVCVGLLQVASSVWAQTPKQLWITDDGSKKLYLVQDDGTLVLSLTRVLGTTSSTAVDPFDGSLWGTGESPARVVNYTTSGAELLTILGSQFGAVRPEGATVDAANTLWVVDDPNVGVGPPPTVFRITRQGQLIGSFPTSAFDGNAKSPQDIAYDPTDGMLWVTDNSSHRIYHITLAGQLLSSFPSSGLNPAATNPQGISVDQSDGTLWLSARDTHHIYHLTRTGTTIASFDTTVFDVNALNPTGIAVANFIDTDGDGMPDEFEIRFGLDHLSPLGNDGADGDPDGDGVTNIDEFLQGTHPRGTAFYYLAEGASGAFFDTRLALLRAGAGDAKVLLRFQRSDGSAISSFVPVPAFTRVTTFADNISGLHSSEFATLVESDHPLVVDRTMTWNTTRYGSHAETSVASPLTTWYLAEGSTVGNFDLFYLLQNPSLNQNASVKVTYLRPSGSPVIRNYVVAAGRRFNIWVDLIPELVSTDVSAVIEVTNGVPIVVERAMYLNTAQQFFAAGHESAGIAAPALEWFLAEGATGPFFDNFVLVANPNATAAQVQATYLRPNGAPLVKSYVVPAMSRFTIWVDQETFGGVLALADTAVSVRVRSLNSVPVIVERAMWWPGPTAATWIEAHNAAGTTVTGTRWALAEGESGGPDQVDTFILIANTSATPGSARVTLYFEDGTSVTKTYALSPTSRFNVWVSAEFPSADGRRYAALVESLGASPAQIVVERAMYSNSGGVTWAAGTDAVATRLQ